MSCDQASDKLSEKLNSRWLVQEEHGFQKGAQCAPWPQELKESLAWIGLSQNFRHPKHFSKNGKEQSLGIFYRSWERAYVLSLFLTIFLAHSSDWSFVIAPAPTLMASVVTTSN